MPRRPSCIICDDDPGEGTTNNAGSPIPLASSSRLRQTARLRAALSGNVEGLDKVFKLTVWGKTKGRKTDVVLFTQRKKHADDFKYLRGPEHNILKQPVSTVQEENGLLGMKDASKQEGKRLKNDKQKRTKQLKLA